MWAQLPRPQDRNRRSRRNCILTFLLWIAAIPSLTKQSQPKHLPTVIFDTSRPLKATPTTAGRDQVAAEESLSRAKHTGLEEREARRTRGASEKRGSRTNLETKGIIALKETSPDRDGAEKAPGRRPHCQKSKASPQGETEGTLTTPQTVQGSITKSHRPTERWRGGRHTSPAGQRLEGRGDISFQNDSAWQGGGAGRRHHDRELRCRWRVVEGSPQRISKSRVAGDRSRHVEARSAANTLDSPLFQQVQPSRAGSKRGTRTHRPDTRSRSSVERKSVTAGSAGFRRFSSTTTARAHRTGTAPRRSRPSPRPPGGRGGQGKERVQEKETEETSAGNAAEQTLGSHQQFHRPNLEATKHTPEHQQQTQEPFFFEWGFYYQQRGRGR